MSLFSLFSLTTAMTLLLSQYHFLSVTVLSLLFSWSLPITANQFFTVPVSATAFLLFQSLSPSFHYHCLFHCSCLCHGLFTVPVSVTALLFSVTVFPSVLPSATGFSLLFSLFLSSCLCHCLFHSSSLSPAFHCSFHSPLLPPFPFLLQPRAPANGCRCRNMLKTKAPSRGKNFAQVGHGEG